jgi:hypothetical protein
MKGFVGVPDNLLFVFLLGSSDREQITGIAEYWNAGSQKRSLHSEVLGSRKCPILTRACPHRFEHKGRM